MEINTSLELFDNQILKQLKTKFNSIPDIYWQFQPIDIAFVKAQEKFGDQFLPLYNIFRIGPPLPSDDRTSIGNFINTVKAGGRGTTVNFLNCSIVVQMDVFSNSMYDMNLSIMDFYRFKKQRQVLFTFDDIGLPEETFTSDVNFDDPETTEITDDLIYKNGRYFRYTYKFTLDYLLFDVNKEIQADQIIIDFYNTIKSPQSLIKEVTIP